MVRSTKIHNVTSTVHHNRSTGVATDIFAIFPFVGTVGSVVVHIPFATTGAGVVAFLLHGFLLLLMGIGVHTHNRTELLLLLCAWPAFVSALPHCLSVC